MANEQANQVTEAANKTRAALLAAGTNAAGTLKSFAEPAIEDYGKTTTKYLDNFKTDTGGFLSGMRTSGKIAADATRDVYSDAASKFSALKTPFETATMTAAKQYGDSVLPTAERTGKPAVEQMEKLYPEQWRLVKEIISGNPTGTVASRNAHTLNVDNIRAAGSAEERNAIALGNETGAVGRARAAASAARMGTAQGLAQEETAYAAARQDDAVRALSAVQSAMGIAQNDVARYQGVLMDAAQKVLDAHNLVAQNNLNIDQAAIQMNLTGAEKAALLQYDNEVQALQVEQAANQWVAGMGLNVAGNLSSMKNTLGANLSNLEWNAAQAAEGLPLQATQSNAAMLSQVYSQDEGLLGAIEAGVGVWTAIQNPTANEVSDYNAKLEGYKRKLRSGGGVLSGTTTPLDTQA